MQPRKRSNGRVKSNLELLAFKIDPETRKMLDDLCADLEAAAIASGEVSARRGWQAQAIRLAIRHTHITRPFRQTRKAG